MLKKYFYIIILLFTAVNALADPDGSYGNLLLLGRSPKTVSSQQGDSIMRKVIEQADMLFEGDVTSSQPVLDRITALEQSSLDNAQLLADLLADDSTDDSANHTPSDTDATEDKTTTGGADADTAEPGKEE